MPNYIRKALNEFVKGLDNIVGNSLINVILYGSYARGEQDKNGEQSDYVDFYIITKEECEEQINTAEMFLIEAEKYLNGKY